MLVKTFRKIYLVSFIFVIGISAAWGQAALSTIHGKINTEASNEILKGVLISIPEYNFQELSNADGSYSISLSLKDSTTIYFSFLGYQTAHKTIYPQNNTRLDITMLVDASILSEVTVEANKESWSDDPRMSVLSIPISQIQNTPSLFGEKDVMKVLQLLPGVQKGGEGSAGLYVRGGGADQNLILLDDAPIYNSNHLFGFLSVFNNDILRSVELTKGGFPARYGGRLSSVLELKTKDGNKEKLHAEALIGLISSKLTIEGPIKKGKSSFIVSARRTYLDLLTKPFLPSDKKVGFYFYDVSAKYHSILGPKDNLRISAFISQDKLLAKIKSGKTENMYEINWRNLVGTLQWNHLYTENTASNLTFSSTRYNLANTIIDEDKGFDKWTSKYSSYIQDFAIKYDWTTRISNRHELMYGIQSTYHRFRPGVNNTVYEKNGRTFANNPEEKLLHSFETGLFLEHIFKPVPLLTINTGFRLSHYLCRGRNYINPEPRLSASIKLSPYVAFKASYSRMNQYVHMLSTTSYGPPLDAWVPTTDITKPMKSEQWAAGIGNDFKSWSGFASLEGFYKKNKNIIAYKDGGNSFSVQDGGQFDYWEDVITAGNGWAYGIEALIKKNAGKFSGWIGYTLSWTWLQFDQLNMGQKYFARYDRRHDGSVVLIYQPNKKITFSTTWTYGSGNAITLPFALYKDPGSSGYSVEYSEKNGYRMPSYHRLDVSVQFHKKLKKLRERTWEISVYNAYNKHNPYFYSLQETGQSENPLLRTRSLQQIVLFPILPSVSYKISFK
ncbi:MAG TPA: TonB-dependent receptor [Cytophagaceae bacterium]